MDTLENLSPQEGNNNKLNEQLKEGVENSGNAGNWYDGLSPELVNNPTVQKYRSAEDQVRGHLELAKSLGQNKVVLPIDGDDISQANFNNAIGVPAEASGYEINPSESMAESGLDLDEFKTVMHKNGLTPKQAQGVLDEYGASIEKAQQMQEQEYVENINKAKAELTKEWGLSYDQNIKQAQSVINKFAGSEEAFEHINSQIGNDPVALKWLANIGKQFSEGSLGDLGSSSGRFTMSPQQAKDEHSKIMADNSDVYWQGVRAPQTVPERQRLERVKYVEGLLRMANAGR